MTPEEEARGFNPPEQHRVWRDVLLPRSIVPLFWVAWLALLPAALWGKLRGAQQRRATSRRVAIESGIIGWTHVYFEELLASAREYFGDDAVVQHTIDRDRPYLAQMKCNLRADEPTHVVWDVRTPGQSWPSSIRQAIGASWFLLTRGITPIVVLTDAFYRRQRWQAAVLTAFRGVVVTFAHERIVAPIFPHTRIIGPLPMPISVQRLEWLVQQRAARTVPSEPRVQFIGSVYPPRDRFLDEVGERLSAQGITLHVNRDKSATSNEDYWMTLVNADVVVTTTVQGPPRPYMDWIWVQQAVFRYAESTAARAALVAGPVDGGFDYFQNGVDFLQFQSIGEAVANIVELIQFPNRLHEIAATGFATSSRIIREHEFWKRIDQALG